MYHGNLEIGAEARGSDGKTDRDYLERIEERRHQSPYAERQIHVRASLSRNEAVIRIRDQGRGFDPASVPDPIESPNFEKLHGRGLLLIHTFMDSVRFNVAGNEITMVKKRST
jgi:anti-sigma regulatory factor (Ser/Thr protein kinase)